MERVGLYPGTFDPVTNGHLDIIGRGLKLVDKLIVGVAISEAKGPMFTLEERVAMLEREAGKLTGPGKGVLEIRPFTGLLIHFCNEIGASIIVRGVRSVSDFEYELQLTAMNTVLDSNIETVFFMADVKHRAVASRLVKEIASLGGEIEGFVPPQVKQEVLEKFE